MRLKETIGETWAVLWGKALFTFTVRRLLHCNTRAHNARPVCLRSSFPFVPPFNIIPDAVSQWGPASILRNSRRKTLCPQSFSQPRATRAAEDTRENFASAKLSARRSGYYWIGPLKTSTNVTKVQISFIIAANCFCINIFYNQNFN